MVYKVLNKNCSGGYVTRVDKSAIKRKIMTNQYFRTSLPKFSRRIA